MVKNWADRPAIELDGERTTWIMWDTDGLCVAVDDELEHDAGLTP